MELYALMLAPVSPHMAEELWMKMGKPYSIHQQSWPKVDQAAAAEEELDTDRPGQWKTAGSDHSASEYI